MFGLSCFNIVLITIEGLLTIFPIAAESGQDKDKWNILANYIDEESSATYQRELSVH